MPNPVLDLTGVGQSRAKQSAAAGPADYFTSRAVITADGLVQATANQGVLVHAVRGDGRRWNPILASTPAVPVPGDMWIQTVSPGVEEVRYCDAAGVVRSLSSGAPTTPTPIAVPLSVLPTVNTLVSVNADAVGLIEWSVGLSKPSAGYRQISWVTALHNGTTAADATVAEMQVTSGPTIGDTEVTLSIGLAGTGPTQTMALYASTDFTGWTAYILGARMVAP